jgi:hypothetical protein
VYRGDAAFLLHGWQMEQWWKRFHYLIPRACHIVLFDDADQVRYAVLLMPVAGKPLNARKVDGVWIGTPLRDQTRLYGVELL